MHLRSTVFDAWKYFLTAVIAAWKSNYGDRTKALRADPSKSRGVRGAIRRPPVEDIPSDRSFWEYRETVGHGAAARLQHMIASSVPSGALGGARDACAPSGVSRLLKSPTGTCTRAHVRPC